jgi:squalene synthase HpnC
MDSTSVSFQSELAQWGPNRNYPAPTLLEAQQYCQKLSHSHYENFHVVSWLLPQRLRQHFYNIYAYCRWSDDLADETQCRSTASELLLWWHGQLADCFRGQASHPVFVALRPTIEQFHLSREPFEALLSAFQQDQLTTRYDSDAVVLDYCVRSANPVGQLVLALGDATSDENIRLSDMVCTGLQLANFCQDISIDAEKGRIYIPKSRMDRHGVSEAMVLQRKVTPELQSLLQEWVEYADEFFVAGGPLVQRVPRWLSLDLRLFIAGGRAILQAIRKHRYDVWTQRVSLSRWNKLVLVSAATCQWLLRK